MHVTWRNCDLDLDVMEPNMIEFGLSFCGEHYRCEYGIVSVFIVWVLNNEILLPSCVLLSRPVIFKFAQHDYDSAVQYL